MAKSKKIAIVVAAIALIAVIGVVGSTLAFFTDQDSKNNTFTMGKVSGTVEEYDEEGSDAEPILTDGIPFTDVVPNKELVKRPFMRLASDSQPAYARIKLTWKKPTGEGQEAMFDQYPPQLLGLGDKWILNETDGFYYYQDKVQPGQPTQELFQKVKIPEQWTNTMTNADFELLVEGHFIQADNFTPGTDPVTGKINSWGQVTIEQFTAPETQQTQPAE